MAAVRRDERACRASRRDEDFRSCLDRPLLSPREVAPALGAGDSGENVNRSFICPARTNDA